MAVNHYTPEEFLREYEHTWSRHHGHIRLAAPIFETTPMALERRLRRYRSAGYDVTFHGSPDMEVEAW
jgi:hypothetical protein